jgi:exosome complex exonuclease DIS3/RRP44
MTQAIYFSSGDLAPKEYYHYGLACPIYTHFTSPIRRYADIVVHRLLAASLGIAPLPPSVQDRVRVHDMAEVINHRHRMAQLVSRASTELYTLLFFENRKVEEDATIVAVKANGIRVMVPRYGIESGITLWQEANFDEEQSGAVDKATAVGTKNPWKLDEQSMTLTGPGGLRYSIFEQLRVRIYVQESKMRRKWLQVDLVEKEATSKPQPALAKHLETSVEEPASSPSSSAPAKSSKKHKLAASSPAEAAEAEKEENAMEEDDGPPPTKSASKKKADAPAPPTKKQKK